MLPSFSPTDLLATALGMAYPSNVYIDKGTFNSAQGDFHIHNGDTEFGMDDFKFIQKNILIDDPMKDFIR